MLRSSPAQPAHDCTPHLLRLALLQSMGHVSLASAHALLTAKVFLACCVTTAVCWLQLPGANSGGPDVKGLADEAAKKSPLGFMNIGELAFDLPGSGVSKDDLPNNVKPGDAAGLPKGPTAKPPSLPNLPKVLSGHSLCVFEALILTCDKSPSVTYFCRGINSTATTGMYLRQVLMVC